MNPIRDFIFSDGQISPDQASATQVMAVTQIVQNLQSGQTTVVKLLDEISVYTLDRKFGQNRRQSYVLLERIIRELPPRFLSQHDFEMVFKLFLKTLEADTENAQQILSFLRTLQTHCFQAKQTNLVQILVEFFGNNKFNTSLYTFDVRNLTYKLILEAISGYKQRPELSEWVASHEETVLRTLVDQTEGEKDPRNLMLILEIWEVAFDNFSDGALGKTAKPIFDAICVYFPITFDDVKNKILVNKQYLIESLNTCLSRPPILAYFMDLILEKLEEQNKEESEEVLKSLSQLFRKSQSENSRPLDFGVVSAKLHQKLNFLLFEITDQTIEATAKQAYREFIIYALSNIKNHGVVNWRNAEFVERILGDFVTQIVKKPNGKNAHSAIDVLLETIQEFPTDLIKSLVSKIFKPITGLADKSATLFVYLESIQQLLTKCVFHGQFKKVKIASPELSGTIELLVQVMDGSNDLAIRETILKTICFARRVTEFSGKKQPKFLDFKEEIYWNTFEAVDHGNNELLKKNDGEQKRKFEIILTNNLAANPNIIFDLYLDSLKQILERPGPLKNAQMEEFLRLNGVMLKKFKNEAWDIVPNSEKINSVLRSLELKDGLQILAENQIQKLFETSIFESLLLPFYQKENLFLETVKPLENPNPSLILSLVESEWFKFDQKYFGNLLQNLDTRDARTWKIYGQLIQKNKFILTEEYKQKIIGASEQVRDIGPIFLSLLSVSFQTHSQFLNSFIASLVADGKMDLASKIISSISKFPSNDSFKPKTPLFRQKLSLFLDKLVDTHLSQSKFDFISAKLSLVNFQIEAGIADQSKAQELNHQFLDFAIESKNNFGVNTKYLALLEHLVKQQSIDPVSLVSEKLLAHFQAATQECTTTERLSLLCHYLGFLGVFLGKVKKGLSPDLRRKIAACLRKSLRHPKRLVRKLAANAINVAEIASNED